MMKIMSTLLTLLLLLSPMAAELCRAQTARKTTVAIMDLEPKGVPETEVSALSDRLRTELFRTGVFDAMERGKMQDILKEQGFQQSGACNTDACAMEVGQLIGVEKMVSGSLGKVGKTYTVNIRMIDVRTGRIERSVTEDYTGEIDRLLTTVMKNVAYTLAASVQSDAAPKKQDKKVNEQALKSDSGSGKKPIYAKWWFWGGIGAVAAGTAAALAGGSSDTGEEPPPTTDTTIPAPPTRP
jgi:TolB-like protein